MARHLTFSSEELVKACVGSKDASAWTEFIRRFHSVVAATVLRTAHRWGEPAPWLLDDLIQDTYLKLCEDDSRLLRSFQPRQADSIYGFLKVVAANVVHDHFRCALAAKRGAMQTEALTEPERFRTQAGEDGFETVSRRIQLEQIDRVLKQVTVGKDQDRNCRIFWLRHRQGLTASEIAAVPSIGLTTEGVESVLLRLSIVIRSHMTSSAPHREAKVLSRQIRSKRAGS